MLLPGDAHKHSDSVLLPTHAAQHHHLRHSIAMFLHRTEHQGNGCRTASVEARTGKRPTPFGDRAFAVN